MKVMRSSSQILCTRCELKDCTLVTPKVVDKVTSHQAHTEDKLSCLYNLYMPVSMSYICLKIRLIWVVCLIYSTV